MHTENHVIRSVPLPYRHRSQIADSSRLNILLGTTPATPLLPFFCCFLLFFLFIPQNTLIRATTTRKEHRRDGFIREKRTFRIETNKRRRQREVMQKNKETNRQKRKQVRNKAEQEKYEERARRICTIIDDSIIFRVAPPLAPIITSDPF